MIVGDRILLIHSRPGEAIYKYLYNKRTPEDRFKYGSRSGRASEVHSESIPLTYIFGYSLIFFSVDYLYNL